MPDSDEPAPARRKRATGRSRPAGTTTAAEEAPIAAGEEAAGEEATGADEAVAERERRAELERLRHKLHRKFH
jgi:hypothetical protein